MSRYFRFPPPGYTLSSARDEIMIELIKLHEEKQQKERRREKREERRRLRREKKQRRNERKERRQERRERRKERRERRENKKDKTCPNSDKSDIVKDQIGQQVCLNYKEELIEKTSEAKSVKFELSSLTEEHCCPNSLPIPTSSCDSTENTSNTKKRASPEDDSYGHSEAILTRLPSLMESQLKGDTGLRKRPDTCNAEGINLRNNEEENCSTSGQIEAGKTNKSMSDDALNPMQCVELQYNDLLENWLPHALQDTSSYAVDSDWLFHGRRTNRVEQDEKRRKCGSGYISSCRSGGLWARAEYLPEVGVLALPFVIPY